MNGALQLPESNNLSRQLVREQLAPLAILFVLSCLINLSLEDALNALGRNEDSARWGIQLGLGIWDLLEGIVLFLVLSWGIPKIRELREAHFEKKPFAESYLNSFLAEYLRMLAQSLLYGLLLILPGVFRYAQLIFVPYVALFARPYRDGKIDALKMSERLARGHVWRYIAMMVATMLVAAGIEMLPEALEFMHLLPMRVLCHALSFFISIWFYAFLYIQFETAMGHHDWSAADGANV